MEQNHITSNETGDISSNNSEIYKFDKREYIVEPVYKDNGSETVTSKLLRLMKADSGKH